MSRHRGEGPVALCRTEGVAETRALAAAVAALLGPGDVVALDGDLGAGKTAFTQGAAAALGVSGPVTSPTFTLAHRYEGRIPVDHLDVYRLDHEAEVADLGLDELFDDAVAFVEWAERIESLLPRDRLEVTLHFVDDPDASDDARLVEVTVRGPSWVGRLDALVDALAPWAVEDEVRVRPRSGVTGGGEDGSGDGRC